MQVMMTSSKKSQDGTAVELYSRKLLMMGREDARNM
jgi:hypothetical protein